MECLLAEAEESRKEGRMRRGWPVNSKSQLEVLVCDDG